MGKFTFWGHTKHFQSMWVRSVMPIFVTLIGWNQRHTSHKTAGEQLAHTRCSDFNKRCLYHPLIYPHAITFCPIRLSKLSWASMNYYYECLHFLIGYINILLNCDALEKKQNNLLMAGSCRKIYLLRNLIVAKLRLLAASSWKTAKNCNERQTK